MIYEKKNEQNKLTHDNHENKQTNDNLHFQSHPFYHFTQQIIHCPQCTMGKCKETKGGYLQCQCFQLQCMKSKNKLKNISTLGGINHIEIGNRNHH